MINMGAELRPDRRPAGTLNRNSAMRETQATGLLVQNLSKALRRNLPLAAVALSIGLVMTAGAARAGSDDEDNRSFSEKFVDGFKGVFKTTNMDTKGIDYRERSPLVVPPKIDLPPPAAAAPEATTTNWPRDPDEKRRKAAIAARKKTLSSQTPVATDPGRPGDPPARTELSFTDKVSNIFGGNKPEAAPFTGEPPREDLTQPPSGYQIPSPNYAYGVGVNKPLRNDTPDKDSKETSSKQ
jgi:hypothetical protein